MANSSDIEEIIVKTEKCGTFRVYVQGDRSTHHYCVTMHDVGLNHVQFMKFLAHPDMAGIMKKMCFLHIDYPGQHPNAENLDGQKYPSMQDLADDLEQIFDFIGFENTQGFVGFGEGAGSNVFLRYAFNHPKRVLGLVLLECTATPAGFFEWGHEKVAAWQLEQRGMNTQSENYLIWHHFGGDTKARMDLVREFRNTLEKTMNPHNLSLFIKSFMDRNDVSDRLKEMRTPVLMVTGTSSSHAEDVEKIFYSLPDKGNSTFLKAEDVGGDIIEEDPGKLAESFLLFLQGIGLAASVPMTRLVHSGSGERVSPTPDNQ